MPVPTPATRPAVFLDLGGTLVMPIFVEDPGQLQLVPGAADAVSLLCTAGFVCPVVTVQSRIEKGFFTETAFRKWFDGFKATLVRHGAFVEGPYLCPHRYRTRCACKKPNDLLYRQAAAELSLGLRHSFVVGDTREDLEAARALGCGAILVRTGWPTGADVEALADYVADDLLAAARWILRLT